MIGLEPLNRFETNFLNRHDQALMLAEASGPQLRRVPGRLPHQHRGSQPLAGHPEHRQGGQAGGLPRRR